jgi:hypothetical protein
MLSGAQAYAMIVVAFDLAGGRYTTLSRTSTLPRVALE